MNFTWYILFQIILVSFTGTGSFISTPTEWQDIEELAEDYPYVVAILNERNEYMCTGFTLDDRTVVTAGSCLTSWPSFVALSAVLGDDTVGKNLLQVSHMVRHSDYSYYVSHTQPSDSIVNCNIALVFVVKNTMDFFTQGPITQFNPSQLRKKKLDVVGYGLLDSGAITLQRQEYTQKACANPAWYYCICGIESSEDSTYENEFGEGGPVILDEKIVGITAAPCGSLFMPSTEIGYNIFTIITVYYDWISKQEHATTHNSYNVTKFKAVANKGNYAEISMNIAILLIIDNLIK